MTSFHCFTFRIVQLLEEFFVGRYWAEL
uniref:Uncharacterized protein n=1 Tax=Rhizophora mucronata TaxID=61149 RepID=A0A2P2Q0W4_RHIMU